MAHLTKRRAYRKKKKLCWWEGGERRGNGSVESLKASLRNADLLLRAGDRH